MGITSLRSGGFLGEEDFLEPIGSLGALDPLLFERVFFVLRVANLVVGFCFAISQRGTNVAFTMVLGVLPATLLQETLVGVDFTKPFRPMAPQYHSLLQHRSDTFLPYVALVACNLLWATDYPLYHILLPHYLPPIVLLTAALLATLVFACIPALGGHISRVERRDIPTLVGAALLLGVIHKGSLMFGISLTSPVDGSIINAVGPLVVLVLSVVKGVDRLTTKRIVGLLIGLSGAVAVILTGNHSSNVGATMVGNLLVVCAVMATSCYTVFLKGMLLKYNVPTVLLWVYGLSALMTLPFGIPAALHHDFSVWDHRATLSLVIMLCLLTYLPNALYNYALHHVEPFRTSIFSYIQPVAAIVLSAILRLDTLRLPTLCFAMLIFVGIGIVLSSYHPHHNGHSAQP